MVVAMFIYTFWKLTIGEDYTIYNDDDNKKNDNDKDAEDDADDCYGDCKLRVQIVLEEV